MQPQPIRTWNAARIASVVAGILVLGIVAGVLGFSVALHRTPWEIVTGQLTPSPQELFQKNNILVLVEGLDYDYTNNDVEFSKNSRSDVIWAVNLEFPTKHIYQLSIPRDMEATLPDGSQGKINQAQADGGVHEAESVISKWLGIPGFDRYMIFRVDTTKDLVNAIGGVDVKVMNSDAIRGLGPNGPLDYVDTWGHLYIHLKPGMQHLNGDQAVGYMRYRHDWCGDPCRIMRQQEVLHALFQKISHDKFNTLLHVNDLIGVLNRDVETNFTRQEELSIASAFIGMPKNGLVTKQVPYVADIYLPDYGDTIVPDTDARARLVRTMLLAPPVPTPTPDVAAIAQMNPASVRVDVENGSGVLGAARRVADRLRKQGFVIASVGNANRSDFATTEVHEHSAVPMAGLKVRQALGSAAAAARVLDDAQPTAAPSDVTVIVGQDLANSLSAQASTTP